VRSLRDWRRVGEGSVTVQGIACVRMVSWRWARGRPDSGLPDLVGQRPWVLRISAQASIGKGARVYRFMSATTDLSWQ
jgi:hypothetical protein